MERYSRAVDARLETLIYLFNLNACFSLRSRMRQKKTEAKQKNLFELFLKQKKKSFVSVKIKQSSWKIPKLLLASHLPQSGKAELEEWNRDCGVRSLGNNFFSGAFKPIKMSYISCTYFDGLKDAKMHFFGFNVLVRITIWAYTT